MHRGEILLHLNFKLSFKLGFVHFSDAAWISAVALLNILKVVLLLEVLFESILHFHSAEEVLDSVPLFVDVEFVQLVFVSVCKFASHEFFHELWLTLEFTLLDVCHDLNGVFVSIVAHLFEIFTDLIIRVKRQTLNFLIVKSAISEHYSLQVVHSHIQYINKLFVYKY